MARNNFWAGFAAGTAAGALAGVAGVLAFRRGTSDVDSNIIRLEKSINIGRPVPEVFAAWANFEQLPHSIRFVQSVQRFGQRSRWRVNIDGRAFEWDAQITQVVPNESLGWKSVSGPHHTGRVSFAPLGEQTVMHVLMNYEPPLGNLGALLPLEGHLEHWIERGLREFKTALEGERVART
ncbi:MAG TPA: SRPBCC family protein, partial [Candidatus Angelobacter sp.]|nr:SRPBCC family protein [Candidatus Angelobacter sp.]